MAGKCRIQLSTKNNSGMFYAWSKKYCSEQEFFESSAKLSLLFMLFTTGSRFVSDLYHSDLYRVQLYHI